MKRFAVLTLALLLALSSFAGCAASGTAAGFDGNLTALAAKIYENHKKAGLDVETTKMDLSDADMVSFNTGLSDLSKVSELVISEPMTGSQPYSLVLVRAKDAADAADLAKEMYDNMNTRKWICVEADTKTAAYCSDIALFFMVNSEYADEATTDSILDAFRASVSGDVTVVG